ncbi:MAG: polysaccharide biosynthesis tyrosine autokinase [Burkholderiaceae bacterium]
MYKSKSQIPGESDNPVTVVSNTGEVISMIEDPDGTIGSLLVDLGAMTPAEVERVLTKQAKSDKLFGEIASGMGFISGAQLEQALARQFNSPFLPVSQTQSISSRVVAAHAPRSPFVEAMRALRMQLGRRWFDEPERRCLAICGVGSDEGRSYVAANLAAVFAQRGERVLLIDADLRRPMMRRLFRMPRSRGLSGLLAGRGSHRPIKAISAVPGLSVLPGGAAPPNPTELLEQRAFKKLLTELSQQFSVIILDTAAAEGSTDAQVVAQAAGACVLVARKDQTATFALQELDASLRDDDVAVHGLIFNEY